MSANEHWKKKGGGKKKNTCLITYKTMLKKKILTFS